jgi:hypothetical protein
MIPYFYVIFNLLVLGFAAGTLIYIDTEVG